MTNAIPLIQLAANHAGYNISGAEIALIVSTSATVCGGAVHLAHQAIAAYGRAGGLEGIKRFLKQGTVAAPLANGTQK